MTETIFEIFFVLLIIIATIAYFRRRRYIRERMGLRDKIEDMFKSPPALLF